MKAVGKIILFESDLARLEEIKTFIQANYSIHLSQKKLAGQFGISQSTLKRHFQFRYQVSMYKYILDLRMTEAMKLLLNRSVPVSEVGYHTGFKDRSTFTHAFTKYFGHPPIHFLRQDEP